jgi:hypothetical protein
MNGMNKNGLVQVFPVFSPRGYPQLEGRPEPNNPGIVKLYDAQGECRRQAKLEYQGLGIRKIVNKYTFYNCEQLSNPIGTVEIAKRGRKNLPTLVKIAVTGGFWEEVAYTYNSRNHPTSINIKRSTGEREDITYKYNHGLSVFLNGKKLLVINRNVTPPTGHP